METVLLLLGLSSMTHLWVVSKPTQWVRRSLRIDPMSILGELLECHLCIGFWIGLIGTLNIPMAALVSVLSVIISNIATPKLN